jgi:hypothetical protein
MVMKKITSLFYVNSNGKKPVREWLLSLDRADRKIIGERHQNCGIWFSYWYAYL